MICSTTVENVLQIGPVFSKQSQFAGGGRMKINPVLTKDYEGKGRVASISRQSQTKPISGKANVKMGKLF